TVQPIWSAKRTLRRQSCQRVLHEVANISLERDIGAGLERQQRDNFAPGFRIDIVLLEIPIPILDTEVSDGMKGLLNTNFHTGDPFSNRDFVIISRSPDADALLLKLSRDREGAQRARLHAARQW